jgi:hypothetical protein
LLAENLDEVAVRASVTPLLVTVAAAAAICGLAARLTKRLPNAALASSFIALVGLGQADLAEVADVLHVHRFIVLGPFLPAIVVYFILRARRGGPAWTSFANAFAIASLVLVAWPVANMAAHRWLEPTRVLPPLPLPSADVAPAERPDVYVLVLDGYGRADVLRELYGLESELPAALTQLGFNLAGRANSNYGQTLQSIASLLNADYLQPLLDQPNEAVPVRQRLADLIARSRVLTTFASAGYRIRTVDSELSLVRPQGVDQRFGSWRSINDFDFALYAQSMLPILSALAGIPQGQAIRILHRDQILRSFDVLANAAPGPGDPPTLTFAHLLIPHPPFVFAADGSWVSSDDQAKFADGPQATGSAESYMDGYRAAIRYTDRRLAEVIGEIIARSGQRRSVIYVQGDHGPASKLDQVPAPEAYIERFGILLGLRVSWQEPTDLYDHVTPVNAMRLLVNRTLGTAIPFVEDRSYYSRFDQPATFVDVTKTVTVN